MTPPARRRPRPLSLKLDTGPRLSESALQGQVRAALSHLRYLTLETGAPRRRTACPQCGHRFTPAGWMGNTPGTPDLLVAGTHWRAADGGSPLYPLWLGLEIKGQGTRISPAQVALADQGRILIARSVAEAVFAAAAAEERMTDFVQSVDQRERLDRWLRNNAQGEKRP